jgi:hypothetical protein
VVLLAEPDTHWLEPVAGTGEALDLITQTRFSTDPDNLYGKGICGEAFRTKRPCIEHDIPISTGASQAQAGESGLMACVALPLTRFGRSIGVLIFFIGNSWARDEEIIALLAGIAENVSVALDTFGRAAGLCDQDAGGVEPTAMRRRGADQLEHLEPRPRAHDRLVGRAQRREHPRQPLLLLVGPGLLVGAVEIGQRKRHVFGERIRSRRNSPSCCSGSPTIWRSRSRASIAPTRSTRPTSGSNISPRMTA